MKLEEAKNTENDPDNRDSTSGISPSFYHTLAVPFSHSSFKNSSKRIIQPQQQRNKGVTRIINGPKKNMIVKRVNHKETKKNKKDTNEKAKT